jgi:hypothetical protein
MTSSRLMKIYNSKWLRKMATSASNAPTVKFTMFPFLEDLSHKTIKTIQLP